MGGGGMSVPANYMPEQQELAKTLMPYAQARLGKGMPTYPGYSTAPLNPYMNMASGWLGQYLNGGAPPPQNSVQPSYNYIPQASYGYTPQLQPGQFQPGQASPSTQQTSPWTNPLTNGVEQLPTGWKGELIIPTFDNPYGDASPPPGYTGMPYIQYTSPTGEKSSTAPTITGTPQYQPPGETLPQNPWNTTMPQYNFPMYGGQLTPQEQQYGQTAMNWSNAGMPFWADPNYANQYYQQAFFQPQYRQFMEYQMPQIASSYNKPGGPGFWGSARADAETKAYGDFMTNMMGKGAEISQAERERDITGYNTMLQQQQAAQPWLMNYSNIPLNKAMMGYQLGGELQNYLGQGQQADISAWKASLPEYNPIIQQALQALGASFQPGYTQEGASPLAGIAGAGAGAAGSILAAYLLSQAGASGAGAAGTAATIGAMAL